MRLHSLAIIITTPPTSNLTLTAVTYIETALKQGVDVKGVFFYQSGVLNASSLVAISSDEFQMNNKWQQLHNDYNLPLHLCYTAAEKSGLSEEASSLNIASCFTVSGLGELVELTSAADRVVQL